MDSADDTGLAALEHLSFARVLATVKPAEAHTTRSALVSTQQGYAAPAIPNSMRFHDDAMLAVWGVRTDKDGLEAIPDLCGLLASVPQLWFCQRAHEESSFHNVKG